VLVDRHLPRFQLAGTLGAAALHLVGQRAKRLAHLALVAIERLDAGLALQHAIVQNGQPLGQRPHAPADLGHDGLPIVVEVLRIAPRLLDGAFHVRQPAEQLDGTLAGLFQRGADGRKPPFLGADQVGQPYFFGLAQFQFLLDMVEQGHEFAGVALLGDCLFQLGDLGRQRG